MDRRSLNTKISQKINGTAADPAPATSWRDILPVHPAAELFPRMSADELRALGEDIRKHGLRELPTVVRQYRRRADGKLDIREYDLVLLDGISRLDAMEGAGFSLLRDGKLDKTLGHKALGLEPLSHTRGGYAELDSDIDPYAFVISRNIHRRHLNAEQKRDLIAKLLKADPNKSDRQIAANVKVSPTFVGKVRAEKEAAGEVSTVDTRIDAKGVEQPARKPPNRSCAMLHRRTVLGDDVVDKLLNTSLGRADELDELVTLNRGMPKGELTKPVQQLVDAATARKAVSAIRYTKSGAAFRREDVNLDNAGKADAIAAAPVPVAPHDDIGPTSAGEVARLEAQVNELQAELRQREIKLTGLESEIEELKAALQAPRPDLITTEALAALTLPKFLAIMPAEWAGGLRPATIAAE
jgi:hypothetical protein